MRGRDIKRYSYEFADQYLIVTHNGYIDDNEIEVKAIDIENYPVIKAYLDESWDIISKRTDKGITPYNLRNCAYMDDFSKQKIVWKRIGSIIRFAFDDKGCLGLDSTCIAIGNNVKFIAAYLNSRVGNYLLRDSPKTGTGDLLISVQAIEPILIPRSAEPICISIIERIIGKAKEKKDFDEDETVLDELLFQYFCFSDKERRYITLVSEELRR